MSAPPEAPVSFIPLLDQYFTLKKSSPDSLLLFRVGDFYEAYGDDAKALSQALEIVLTGRDSRGTKIPMAGVPHHTLDTHVRKLLIQGYKVAVSEQLEEPGEAKGLLRRDIVRILTPGTVIEPELLNEKEPNYLLAIFPEERGAGDSPHPLHRFGFSWCDISTGLWFASEVTGNHEILYHELSKIAPKEILIPEKMSDSLLSSAIQEFSNGGRRVKISLASGKETSAPEVASNLPELLQKSCFLLLQYLADIYRGSAPSLSPPAILESRRYLVLDFPTRRNLEIFQNLASGQEEGSLFHLMNHCKTSMGMRLLRHWILHPLLEISEIEKRQEAVAKFLEHPKILLNLQKLLSKLGDLERLAGRVSFGTANARDLLAIKTILEEIPAIKSLLAALPAELLEKFAAEVPDFTQLHAQLSRGIHPDPPLGLREGGLIQPGFHEQLDALKEELRNATAWIAELEEREKNATGIKSLKVGFNQIFGYFLEVTRSNLPLVPSHYIRKQTLANVERFIIEDLKKQEAKILSGQEKCKNLEYELFRSLREEVKAHDLQLREAARHLACLDVLASLAALARERQYARPVLHQGDTISISAGRHPVVETGTREAFVPNDCLLDSGENRLLIVTGPNMAGKSTYLRQIALVVLLAQMGSFVPAEAAQIGIVDRIFTRIGASDDLHRGQSTFFVEMKETAEILQNATNKSLILLDEIGRGTSTFDGLSLAWAIAEELLKKRSKVLFATHYHEMIGLAAHHAGAKNISIAVQEEEDSIVFLRRIVPGGSDKSYGIHVAKLAGIPEPTVQRAKQILLELEERDVGKRIKAKNSGQLSFLTGSSAP